MSYVALYRKYRPSKFVDVIGQDTTIKILKNSIVEGKVGHAYLFSGPRGTGKTSIAKIFARAVNCINPLDGDVCGNCNNCVKLKENDTDIIEIDAASNNGVDEIREIRSSTKLMPSIGKYKIYIIDEVHMLSTGAFNALLKTLEDPPSHVIFILATTEIQKIPLTILSRCQRFDFHKIQSETLLSQLKKIVQLENKKLDDKILDLIVNLSDGCCRDAINFLDQILSMENVEEKDIYDIAGEVPNEIIFNLINYIVDSDYESGLYLIDEIVSNGKNINNIINKMLIIFRNISIYKKNTKLLFVDDKEKEKYKSIDIKDNEIIQIIKILLELNSELKKSTMQKIMFEIYFMQMCNIFQNNNDIFDNKVAENGSADSLSVFYETQPETNEKINNDLFKIRIGNVLSTADKSILNMVRDKYIELEEYSSNKAFNNAVSILNDGKIVVASKEYLLIAFNYDSTISLFKKNLNEVEELIKLLMGKNFKVVGITNSEWEKIKKEYVKDRNKFKYIKEENIKTEQKKIEEKVEETDTVFDIFGKENVTIK